MRWVKSKQNRFYETGDQIFPKFDTSGHTNISKQAKQIKLILPTPAFWLQGTFLK